MYCIDRSKYITRPVNFIVGCVHSVFHNNSLCRTKPIYYRPIRIKITNRRVRKFHRTRPIKDPACSIYARLVIGISQYVSIRIWKSTRSNFTTLQHIWQPVVVSELSLPRLRNRSARTCIIGRNCWRGNETKFCTPRGRSVSHGRLWSPRVFLVRFARSNFSIIYQIYFSHVCVCVSLTIPKSIPSMQTREINYLLIYFEIESLTISIHPFIVKRIFFSTGWWNFERTHGNFRSISVFSLLERKGQSRKANLIATRRRRDAARRDEQRLLCRRDNHWPLNLFQEG